MGRSGSVSVLADILNRHADKAVAGFANAYPWFGSILVGVNHHRDVDIIEFAAIDQLLLASQIPDFSLVAQLLPEGDFNVFFGGNSHKSDIACQCSGNFSELEAQGRSEHGAELKIVPTGMSSAGQWIGGRAVGADDGVQFTDYGDVGAGCSRVEGGLYSGERQPLPTFISEAGEKSSDGGGRLGFLVAQFRSFFHLLRDLYDLACVFINDLTDFLL